MPSNPLEIVLNLLREKGCKPEKSGAKWKSICPAHEDSDPSLSISTGRKNNVLFYCHAGCETKDILNTLGLEFKDIMSPKETSQPKGELVATYDYRDENGRVLFQKLRYSPKNFLQRRRHQGEWSYKLEDTRRVLYNLPEILDAEKVYIVEGEKDADTLRKHGLVATTNPEGASKRNQRQKWRKEYTEFLRNKEIVVLTDNDESGLAFQYFVASKLNDVAKSVMLMEKFGDKPHYDVTDYFKSGKTIEEFKGLEFNAEPFDPAKPAPGKTKSDVDVATVDENSEIEQKDEYTALWFSHRFEEHHGENIHYCNRFKSWHLWNGAVWKRDEENQVFLLIENILKRIKNNAYSDSDKKLHKAVTKFETRHGFEDVSMLSGFQENIAITPAELDNHPWLLCAENVTIDLKTGKTFPHDKANLITKSVPIVYDRDAKCERFDNFLMEIFEGKAEIIEFVWRVIGYTLTGSTRERCMFILYGAGGDNGKSTLLSTIGDLMGDYSTQTPTETLMRKQASSIPNDIAGLCGARFVTAVESDEGRRLAEALLKQLTGGDDTISARFLHSEYFEFKPEFKIFLATNHKPAIRGQDNSIWRRIRLIPFEYSVPIQNQDPELANKLRMELPGILNKAIDYCLSWQTDGLKAPVEVTEAVEDYRIEMDDLGDFLEEYLEMGNIDDNHFSISKADMFKLYQKWADEGGINRKMTKKTLGMALLNRGIKEGRKSEGRFWRGVKDRSKMF